MGGDDEQTPERTAVFFSLADRICALVVRESRSVRQGSRGLKARDCDDCSTRFFRAEEDLRRAWLENESVMTTFERVHSSNEEF